MREKCRKIFYETKVKELKQSKPKDWWRKVNCSCGLHSSTKDSLEHLKHDTIDHISLCNLINNAFLDPTKDYTALDDSILLAFDNVIDDPFVVTEEEVLSCLKCIRAGKSNGPDEVPNWFLEKFAVILVAPVTTVLNCSFREGRLPRVWKLANVCPIPKSDQVLDVSKDLRPISLTSTLCKIAEEVIISSHRKPLLLTCMDFNQFGFVPGSCTTFALISLIYRWSEVLDKSDSSV